MNYREAFDAVVADPRYLANLDWGEARPGHPEGTVRAHIAEIEPNLEQLRPKLSDEDYWKLKLLVHTHDNHRPQESRIPRSCLSRITLRRRRLAGDGPVSR